VELISERLSRREPPKRPLTLRLRASKLRLERFGERQEHRGVPKNPLTLRQRASKLRGASRWTFETASGLRRALQRPVEPTSKLRVEPLGETQRLLPTPKRRAEVRQNTSKLRARKRQLARTQKRTPKSSPRHPRRNRLSQRELQKRSTPARRSEDLQAEFSLDFRPLNELIRALNQSIRFRRTCQNNLTLGFTQQALSCRECSPLKTPKGLQRQLHATLECLRLLRQ
jgi:hypothetical protein